MMYILVNTYIALSVTHGYRINALDNTDSHYFSSLVTTNLSDSDQPRFDRATDRSVALGYDRPAATMAT